MKLTTLDAQAVMAAATAKAAALAVPMNIVILDAGGHLKSFLRMDGALLGSIDIAQKKAKTSVLFESNSESVWEYCKPGAPAHGLELTNQILATFAGGVPLRAGTGMREAVAVLGHLLGEHDALEHAQAAATELLGRLKAPEPGSAGLLLQHRQFMLRQVAGIAGHAGLGGPDLVADELGHRVGQQL